MTVVIFILLFIAVAFVAVMTAGMQIQINKLTAITETHGGRIAENRARTENNDARIKKFSNATHTEIQKMWADQDSAILKLEEIANDIKRLDELEEDTRKNLLIVAEQVKTNLADIIQNSQEIEQNTKGLRDIESYYVNYCSRKDKNNV